MSHPQISGTVGVTSLRPNIHRLEPIGGPPLPSLQNNPRGLPIVFKGDHTVEYVLIAISLILIILFWCWIMTLIRSGPPSSKVLFSCTPGQCATNIYNGEKRCADTSTTSTPGVVLYDPAYEVCNSKFTCENIETPYALWSDGSTNSFGVCEPNTTCRCLRQAQCSTYALTMFTMLHGSIYLTDQNDQRFTFQQSPLSSLSLLGSQQIAYTNSNTQFCAIKPYHLNRVSPGGCGFLDYNVDNQSYVNGITQCMHDNPCMIGTIAFIPKNISEFKSAKSNVIYEYPVACVPGPNPCLSSELPVFDYHQGLIQCLPGPSFVSV
jgi:hypothetical protein